MNPEFRRNVWLELTPRRLALMTVVLALAFVAAALPGGFEHQPATLAQWLYYLIVVIWGTRNAGLSVVGEIRDRTWDSQRLSSLSASQMTWGKLFGATIYNWYGGAICLAILLSAALARHGTATAVLDLVYYVAIGIIAQAASFLASLIAVRRRQGHSRLEVFGYQIVGVAAAIAVYAVWEAADPQASLITHKPAVDAILWWGRTFDARPFLLVSLALFAVWTFVACYREMRLELMMRNGPSIWLTFLVFIGAYVAGFDGWLSQDKFVAGWDQVGLRLALGATTYLILTYIMVLIEPKDRVQFRWLIGSVGSGRLGAASRALQAWMMSYAATLVVAIALIAWLGREPGDAAGKQAVVAAALGFLTRDVSIFVLVQTLAGRRRSDLAAIAILFALYVFIPAIVSGLKLNDALVIFFPQPSTPLWLGTAVAWAEAMIVATLAFAQISLKERGVAATAG